MQPCWHQWLNYQDIWQQESLEHFVLMMSVTDSQGKQTN